MTDEEAEGIAVKLCQLWPRKFTDDELVDWRRRLSSYNHFDVMKVLDRHKETSKFAPKVSEVLPHLKGKQVASTQSKDMRCADVYRQQNDQWRNVKDDREIVCRYWRSQFVRRDQDIQRSRQRVIGNDKILARLDTEDAGNRRRYQRECMSGLVSVGVESDEAERMAAWATGTVQQFREFLDDLRGVTNYDPFAEEAAA